MRSRLFTALIASMLLFPTASLAEKIDVTVKGMVCPFCAQGITKTLSKKPGVHSVNVDLEQKLVKIETKEGAAISDEDLKTSIADAGYDVVKIERSK